MTDDKPKSNKVMFFLTRSQIDGLRYYLDSDKEKKPHEPGSAMRANLTRRGLLDEHQKPYQTTYHLTRAGVALLHFLHLYEKRRGRPPG